MTDFVFPDVSGRLHNSSGSYSKGGYLLRKVDPWRDKIGRYCKHKPILYRLVKRFEELVTYTHWHTDIDFLKKELDLISTYSDNILCYIEQDQ